SSASGCPGCSGCNGTIPEKIHDRGILIHAPVPGFEWDPLDLKAASTPPPFNFITDDPDSPDSGESQFFPVQDPTPNGTKDTSYDNLLKAKTDQKVGRIDQGIGRFREEHRQRSDENDRQGIVPHHQGLHDKL